ncbi:MFS transporter [Sphingobium sp. Sx8-8]|uniref:MFS transporter n=1 Tax=Sphingobium sp. Sx8-8 TaxID=2933617 RepID=UPI001F567A13|nr:MFS transporter [Sphingobium sp. Sx8-8]
MISPAAALTNDVRGRPWRLLLSLGIVFFILLTLYAAVLGVLLPNQIQNIDPARKTAVLGTIFAITSVFSTLTTPIAGALSDRTRTRFGRRTPWILLGSAIGGGALMLVPLVSGLVAVTLLWLVATVSLNSMQPAITAIVADRFEPAARGVASGVVGAAMTAGVSAGTILGGLFAQQLGLAYFALGAAIAAVSTAFVLLNPETPFTGPRPVPFRLASFARSFWVSPRHHPDFAWAFAGRFTIYMGYQAVLTYLLYILQDHVGLSQHEANITIARLSSITFVALIISGLTSGWLSDRIRRRKPLVFAASVIMAAAVAAPLIAPTMGGMICYAILIGIGYGAFMSVDLALMTEVLPRNDGGEDATGKDLGILTTAVNVPQILSPALAALLLSLTGGNYPLLFIAAGLFVLAGAFLVLPIRSVK